MLIFVTGATGFIGSAVGGVLKICNTTQWRTCFGCYACQADARTGHG